MATTDDVTSAQPLAAIPILRIFDQDKAYEFYRDFLGFEVVWEHRFADGMPRSRVLVCGCI